jgi:hypothetical protein
MEKQFIAFKLYKPKHFIRREDVCLEKLLEENPKQVSPH